MKSRSRLKKNQDIQAQEQDTASLEKVHRTSNSNNLSKQYIKHVPLLILSMLFFFWCIQVITTKQPQAVANFLVHQLYLPLLLPFFLFITFFTGYLTLNIKRGSVIALFSSLLLLFRLQHIEFTYWWIFIFCLAFILFFVMTKKRI